MSNATADPDGKFPVAGIQKKISLRSPLFSTANVLRAGNRRRMEDKKKKERRVTAGATKFLEKVMLKHLRRKNFCNRESGLNRTFILLLRLEVERGKNVMSGGILHYFTAVLILLSSCQVDLTRKSRNKETSQWTQGTSRT